MVGPHRMRPLFISRPPRTRNVEVLEANASALGAFVSTEANPNERTVPVTLFGAKLVTFRLAFACDDAPVAVALTVLGPKAPTPLTATVPESECRSRGDRALANTFQLQL